jgi:ABC-type glutathione transport system ATPase component
VTPPPVPLIEAVALRKRFRARGGLLSWFDRRAPASGEPNAAPAVDEVSVTIHAGDRIGIVGESGGGKTTLGRLLAGLLRPDAGVVRWRGQDIAQLTAGQRHRLRRHHVQFLFQNQYASLNPRLTALQCVVESVRCHRGLRGTAARDAAQALLVRADAAHYADRRVGVLSGGERRRVTLACLLAAEPAVVIADEPAAGLDPLLRREATALLAALVAARPETALVVVSHELELVETLCERVWVMREGRIIEQLRAPRPEAAAQHPYTRRLYAAREAERLPTELVEALGRDQRGVATMEYITLLGAGTIFLGYLIYALGAHYRVYLDFAQWWLSIPIF